MSDEPSAQEIAEAAAEVAAVAAALEGPAVYHSREKGPELVEGPAGLNPTHADRAAKAVQRGDRSASPATLRALKRQARTDYHSDR
jgi:hypothetical protein